MSFFKLLTEAYPERGYEVAKVKAIRSTAVF